MVNAAAQYRKALKKELRCRSNAKDRLLKDFDKTLATYLDENIDPSMDDLIYAFGPVEEMAATLMTEVSLEDRLAHKKSMQITRIIAIILAAFFAVSTGYVFYMKEHSNLISSDEVFEEDINWQEHRTDTENLS